MDKIVKGCIVKMTNKKDYYRRNELWAVKQDPFMWGKTEQKEMVMLEGLKFAYPTKYLVFVSKELEMVDLKTEEIGIGVRDSE